MNVLAVLAGAMAISSVQAGGAFQVVGMTALIIITQQHSSLLAAALRLYARLPSWQHSQEEPHQDARQPEGNGP